MKASSQVTLSARLLLGVGAAIAHVGVSKALDLSREPCNVFMGAICVSLPSDQSLHMDAPFDCERFRFLKSDKVVAIAYVQNSPETMNGAPSFVAKSGAFRVTGYKSSSQGQERIEVVFAPADKTYLAVHFYANVNSPLRDDVVGLVAGLRICERPAPGALVCPLQTELGPKLAKWLTH